MVRSLIGAAFLGFAGAALADGAGAPASPPAPAAANTAARPDAASAGCLHDTGTHLKPKPGECLSSPGHSFGSDELSSTGATDVGGGLRMMDPTLTTTH
jgi:hypothetical protein